MRHENVPRGPPSAPQASQARGLQLRLQRAGPPGAAGSRRKCVTVLALRLPRGPKKKWKQNKPLRLVAGVPEPERT